ncbi:hypothetical protein AB0M36_26895 [Actinoplanes sp. NPDC051346]|uniref:hypothetical protein n=1 Tax=Actinoplanes sp. NPDC051346 TaxID=3155048 RepID=UPI00341B9323
MRIAVVDGYSTGRLLAAMLHDRGAQCLHVQSQPHISEFFLRGFAAAVYEADLGYTDDPRQLAGLLRKARVERIIAGTESGVTLADTLNHLLELPGNDHGTRAARRDKVAMAAAARAAGLATPYAEVFDDAGRAGFLGLEPDSPRGD